MFSFFSFFVRERSREIKLIIEKSFHWIIRVAKINDDDQTNIQMIRYNSEDQITKVENVCTSDTTRKKVLLNISKYINL